MVGPTNSLQELEETVSVAVLVTGEPCGLPPVLAEESEQDEVLPTSDADKAETLLVTSWLTEVATTPGGVTTVDHNPELAGASGMVMVTSTVEVRLRPLGNVRVKTEVISLPRGSRAVTVAVGPEMAGIVIVTLVAEGIVRES